MARTKSNRSSSANNSTADLGFEAKLWSAADKLRSNMDAGEYKHVVLGLIFLKYISDTFEEHHAKLIAAKDEYAGANAEDPAAELLAKLLGDEIRMRSKRNLVQSREFSEMLKKTLNAYHNRAIATQEVIEELIKLAKQMSAANQRGVDLGLNDDEVAFYDALAANDSAVEAMGKDELKVIAAELVTQVRKSVTIDWTLRESARAKIRVLVKRILRKHGYLPIWKKRRLRLS